MVLLDAICTMNPPPVKSISARESGTLRESPSPTSAAPKTEPHSGTSRPSPSTVRREARNTAPQSAPTPDAAIRKPSVFAPPCSVCAATTGSSTVYGMPSMLMSARRSRIARMGGKPNA
jgi:hypothetical protein